jgi:hypothetical protein
MPRKPRKEPPRANRFVADLEMIEVLGKIESLEQRETVPAPKLALPEPKRPKPAPARE